MEIFTSLGTAAEATKVAVTEATVNEGIINTVSQEGIMKVPETIQGYEIPFEIEPMRWEAISLQPEEIAISDAGNYKTLEEVLTDASVEEVKIYEDANLIEGTVNDREVLMRTDIDYDAKDQFGRTNLERMEQGLAPLVDGQPIELHHIGQEMDSPLAELTRVEHRGEGNYSVLHDVTKESEINRNLFNLEKEAHWQGRAEQIKVAGGVV